MACSDNGWEPLDLDDAASPRMEQYAAPPQGLTRHLLALIVIVGFAASVLLVVAAIVASIALDAFSRDYLTALASVGSLWAGLTGAVVGFYFGQEGLVPEV